MGMGVGVGVRVVLTLGLVLRLLRRLVGLRLVGGGGRGGGVDAAVGRLGGGPGARAALHADQVLMDTTAV